MDAVRRRISLLIAIGCAGVALVIPSTASSAAGGTISGTLIDQNGDPLSGICVYALTGPFSPAGSATSDATGFFSVTLAPGSYKVGFTSTIGCSTGGDQVEDEYYQDTTDFNAAHEFVIVDGSAESANATLQRVIPPSGGSISGTVTDGTNGIDGACVDAFDSLGGWVAGTLTDASGDYSLIDVPAGDYKVRFKPCGPPSSLGSEYYLDAPDFPSADDVSVSVGVDTAGIDAVLTTADPPGSISGTVTDSLAVPLQGVCVAVLDLANEFTVVAFAVTDADGVYSIGSIPRGSYKLIFTTDPPCPSAPRPVVEEFYDDESSFNSADIVNVGSGAALTIDEVLNVNPVANDDPAEAVAEDSASNELNVLANDTDTDNDAIEITNVSTPTHGSAAIVDGAPDKISYTPAADYCGADTFTYTVNGGDTADVTVDVTCVDDAPTANDDPNESVAEDSSGNELDVAANDTDVENDPIQIVSVGDPPSGTTSVVDGVTDKVSYTPDANFCGTDSFLYQVPGGDTAFVTVDVTCSPDDPDAVDDSKTAAEDSDAAANNYTVLSNDSDPDAATTLNITAVSDPGNGSAAVVDGSPDTVSYVPDLNYCNDPGAEPDDTFTYTVSDGTGRTDTATVSVAVGCVDDAATALDDAATVAEDSGATTINVRANDTDPDASKDLVTGRTNGAHGAVAITNGGADVSYTPAADYCGADAFTYTVAGGDTANVAVTVTCVDDNPVAVNDSKTVVEDSGANAIDVLTNDTDVDAGSKAVGAKTNGAHGAVAITNGGADVSYTPDADYCGADAFTYTLNGGSTATVAVTVTCVDDPIPGPGPDTQAPDVKINSGPNTKTKDATPTFTFSSTDASAHFICSVDGKPATPCTSPFTTKKLKKGKHTFAVSAVDAANNTSAAVEQSFTVKKKKRRH